MVLRTLTILAAIAAPVALAPTAQAQVTQLSCPAAANQASVVEWRATVDFGARTLLIQYVNQGGNVAGDTTAMPANITAEQVVADYRTRGATTRWTLNRMTGILQAESVAGPYSISFSGPCKPYQGPKRQF
jgi:hypothetical protein